MIQRGQGSLKALEARTVAEAQQPIDLGHVPLQYVGSLVGVEYAEPFKARSPLLISDPTLFVKTPFG